MAPFVGYGLGVIQRRSKDNKLSNHYKGLFKTNYICIKFHGFLGLKKIKNKEER